MKEKNGQNHCCPSFNIRTFIHFDSKWEKKGGMRTVHPERRRKSNKKPKHDSREPSLRRKGRRKGTREERRWGMALKEPSLPACFQSAGWSLKPPLGPPSAAAILPDQDLSAPSVVGRPAHTPLTSSHRSSERWCSAKGCLSSNRVWALLPLGVVPEAWGLSLFLI